MSALSASRPHPLRVLLVVLVAFGINSLSITIAGNAMIFAGSFAYMTLVLLLPWRWAVPAVTLAVLPTYFNSGYPYALFVSILEVLWLATLFRFTRRYAILLDLTFWIVIGVPFSSWLMLDVSGFPVEIVLLMTTKQMLIQLCAVVFAQFIVNYTSFPLYVYRKHSRGRRLRDLVFNYIIVMAAVPLILVAVGFSQIIKVAVDREDMSELSEAAIRVAREIDLFLQVHRESVETAARFIETGAGGRPEDVLVEIQQAHPAFLTMLVADREGQIIQTAPADLLGRARGSSVIDRDYFKQAREQDRPQISGAFRGRGLGNDLLVAISAPIHDKEGRFSGIVQGAVELERFGRLAAEAGQLGDLQYVLADVNGRTIYSGPDMGIPALSNLRHHVLASFLNELPSEAFVFNQPNRYGILRAFKAVGVRSAGAGILVIAVRPELTGFMQRADFYLLIVGVVIGVFITASMVTRVAVNRLSAPLENFARLTEVQAASGEVETVSLSDKTSLPQEIDLIYTAFNRLALSLRKSYDELKHNNAVLDQRVADRTAALKAAYDSKTAFLAMTSHEIRTPLNAILGLTEALLEQPLNPTVRERLRTIHSSGVNLIEVVNDLLDLSQAEAGRLVLRTSRIDICELCRDIFRLFSDRAEQHGILLQLQLSADCPVWVMTDGVRLRQVLINLVGNALKYTQKGSIVLRCDATMEKQLMRVCFIVRDSGPGIPADKLGRLFDPYYRVDDAHVQGVAGNGLGLPISQFLVALLGGSLEVKSTVGVGTEFFFDLHLMTAEMPGNVPADRTSTETKLTLPNLRILAVDDNAANQEVLRALLEDRCARLEVVGSGLEAIARLKDETFDVALVDLEMPGIDGIEVVRQIRAMGDSAASVRCRILAISAYHRDYLQEHCLGNGFDGYLEKPLNRADLMDVIASTVRL